MFYPIKQEYKNLLYKDPPTFINELPNGKYYKINLAQFFSDPTII